MRTMIALAVLALTACGEPAKPVVPGQFNPTGEVLATVNGMKVTQGMVDIVTSNMPPKQVEQMKAGPQWDQMIEQVAIGEVLYSKAIEKGLHNQDDVKVAAAMAARNAVAREFLDSIADEAISEDKVKAKYEEQSVRYAKPQVQAKHILVREETLANDLKAQIDGGADFDALAKEHSVDPGTKDKGGDLGWFEKSRMVGPFAEAAFNGEKGATVGPVQARFGFHIINILDKRDAIPLDDVRSEIEEQLKRDSVEGYLNDLKGSWSFERAGAATAAPADAATPAPADAAAPPAGDKPADAHGDHAGHDH